MAGEVAGIGALLRPNKYSILKFVEIHPGSSYVRISPLRYRHHASADACCLLADHARRPSRCLRAAIPQEGLQRQAAKSTRMTALWPSTGLSSKVLHVVLCVCVCVHVSQLQTSASSSARTHASRPRKRAAGVLSSLACTSAWPSIPCRASVCR